LSRDAVPEPNSGQKTKLAGKRNKGDPRGDSILKHQRRLNLLFLGDEL